MDGVGQNYCGNIIQVGSLASPTWLASLASAPPSVSFARSITGRDELARFSYCECGLRSLQLLRVRLTLASLASLAHSHGCDQVGKECD